MDEDELRFPVLRFEPGDDVGLAHVALGDVGEDFLAKEPHGSEVEPYGIVTEVELEEIPEEGPRIVLKSWSCPTGSVSSPWEDEVRGLRPPGELKISAVRGARTMAMVDEGTPFRRRR
jgi:hypothetical protein